MTIPVNFRPDSIGKIFGQDHIINTIQQWVEQPSTMPQSILFQGSYGCGKTTLARILAKALTSTSRDIEEINASDCRGIDDVRSLIEATKFSPFGKAKVFIVDELHQLTQPAQSAFLKVIEEPPTGTYFFLCTTEPSKLLPTIRSRCTQIEVKLLNKEAATELMQFLTKGKLSQPVMDAIFLKTGGHARDIVKLVEISSTQGAITVDQINAIGGYSQDQVINALRAIRAGESQSEQDLHALNQALQQSEENMISFCINKVIDDLVYAGDSMIANSYFEFIQIRVLRKEYKVSALDQLNHFIAKVKHTHTPAGLQ